MFVSVSAILKQLLVFSFSPALSLYLSVSIYIDSFTAAAVAATTS